MFEKTFLGKTDNKTQTHIYLQNNQIVSECLCESNCQPCAHAIVLAHDMLNAGEIGFCDDDEGYWYKKELYETNERIFS
jgi:hypothetical protein